MADNDQPALAEAASHSNPHHDDDDGRYRVLVEFAHRHLDFFMAELEAVLALNGIRLSESEECRLEPLLHQDRFDALVKERSETDPWQGFARRPFAVLSFAADSKWAAQPSSSSSIGQVLLERCVLVRSVVELWAMAPTLEACAQQVQHWQQHSKQGQRLWKQQVSRSDNASWKLTIHTLGATYTRDEQAAMREQLACFLNELPGPVQMKAPDEEYLYIREVALDHKGGAIFPRGGGKQPGMAAHHDDDEEPPLACYLGRLLGGGRRCKGRGRLDEYTLKSRRYLGPTSMDAELAFCMSNLALVRPGSLVLDPFVGTGSILIAAALHGASHCVGTDIDIRVLRGKQKADDKKEETVWANFAQYGLPRPELIRSDNALYSRHFRHDTTVPLYTALLCDPPYGIRAGARQSGARREVRPLTAQERLDHIPQTKPYPVSEVMGDLLDVAARVLERHGRLVYVIPSFCQDFDEQSDLPRHPCLRLVQCCYQPLSSLELGRRVVALEKVHDYDATQVQVYRNYCWKHGPASADKCANLRQKLQQAAQAKPGHAEKLAYRKQKRKQHQQAKREAKRQQQEQQQAEQQQQAANAGATTAAAAASSSNAS